MVLGRLVISIVACVVALIWMRHHKTVTTASIVAYCGIRLGILVVYIFALKGSLPGDLPGFMEQAQRALNGEIPNRDFSTPYSIPFVYLLALPLLIWEHPFSYIVMFAIAECFGILLIQKALLKLTNDAALVNKSMILYMCSPIVLQLLWLSGQDEALQVTLVGLLLYIYASQKENTTTVLSFVGTAVTKIFSLWLIAPFLMTYKPSRWLLFLGLVACFCGVLVFFDIKLFSTVFERPAGQESDHLETMVIVGNVWWLVQGVLGFVPAYLPEALVLVSFIAILVFCFSKCEAGCSRNPHEAFWNVILPGLILFPFAFNVFYKMTYVCYVAYAIPFISLFFLKYTSRAVLVVYLSWAVLSSINWPFQVYFLRKPTFSSGGVVLVWIGEFLIVAVTIYLGMVFIRHYARQGYSLKAGFVNWKNRLLSFK